ncbi:MAG: hypothetical protein HQK88_14765 [Nitrospirae bacterium]|nr:hypothetical protein [Nitrospirota bacterium]MBF0521291.1 hypothetical protein [Nitrospirota bacterium]MBF0535963.1 hypothetical protein [Nitrospirota bacterium]MBF0618061.1 hypothetical protein [Nitrospirota bacterium]
MSNKLFIICLVCFLFSVSNSFAEEVFIKASNDYGRGITKRVGKDCFVITAKHVVENANPPVTIYFEGNRHAEGTPSSFAATDLAVIKLDNYKINCSDYSIVENINNLVKRMVSGQLIIAEEDGATNRKTVKIVGTDATDTFKIKSETATFILQKGHSGSALYLDDKGTLILAGILLSVNSKDNIGTVYKINYINATVNLYFGTYYSNTITTISPETVKPTAMPTHIYEGKRGCIKGDCRNGYGILVYDDKSRYEGEFKNGGLNGQGTLAYANGNKYVGVFRDGQVNGQGNYTYANGDKYVGQFKDGKSEGDGVYTFGNGNKYEGHFKDAKSNGWGVFTYTNGDRYAGQFKDGKGDGDGHYTYADGTRFAGLFKDGKKNGHGVYTYADGSKYEGEFKDNKKDGRGIFTYPDGSKIDTSFANDKPEENYLVTIGERKGKKDNNFE